MDPLAVAAASVTQSRRRVPQPPRSQCRLADNWPTANGPSLVTNAARLALLLCHLPIDFSSVATDAVAAQTGNSTADTQRVLWQS